MPSQPTGWPGLSLRRGGWLSAMHVSAGLTLFGLLCITVPLSTSWVFLAAAAACMALVPVVARIAQKHGVIARPGGRQNHERATPLLGGIAIFVVVSTALAIVGFTSDPKAFGVLAGGVLVFGLGLVDDIRGVGPRTKVYVQMLAAGCLIIGGFQIATLHVAPFAALDLGSAWGPALIVCWVLIATNALNIVDGLDGLAAGIVLLAGLTLAVVGVWPVALLAVAGAAMGFLYFNLPRARVFMGDAGSLYLGFVLASAVLLLPPARMVPIGLAVFAYPIGDVVLTLTRRLVRGQPLMRPDRSHIHHKTLAHLGSRPTALLLALLFATVEILVALAYPGLPSLLAVILGWAGIAVLLVGAGQYTLSTVMATREPVQRVHVVTRYVRDSIRLASRRRHIVTALQHLVEGMGLERLSLTAFDVDVSNRLREFPDIRHHSVSVVRGEALWVDERGAHGPRVEVERETTVVSIVRRACERLAYLTTDEHLTTVADPVPSGVPFARAPDVEEAPPGSGRKPRADESGTWRQSGQEA